MLITTMDQADVSYATFKSLANKDRSSILIDLSGIPAEGQDIRTDEAIRLYKHYTDSGYTVYIVLHGLRHKWSRSRMIQAGVPSNSIHESDLCEDASHTLEQECEFCARFYNAFRCGQVHCVCSRKHCIAKQFAYVRFGIISNMHNVDDKSYVRSDSGHQLKTHDYICYTC